MKDANIKKAADVFKLLSDPTRLRIITLLIANKKLCVNEIADLAGSSQSATSHQLAKLEASEIVVSFRMGQTMCYEIKNSNLTKEIKKTIHLIKP